MLNSFTDKKPGSLAKSNQQSRPSLSSAQHPEVRQILQRPVVQPKLRLGASNDSYEQEAERVAEQVLRMPEPGQSAADAPSVTNAISYTQSATQKTGVIQTKQLALPIEQEGDLGNDEKDGLLQAEEEGDLIHPATPGLTTRIQFLQGAGQPLSSPTRNFFETRFGADFSQVRVHDDAQGAALARSVSAHAFTYGRNIIFGEGEYAPATASGRKLLAHELTHVLQQNAAATADISRQTIARRIPAAQPPIQRFPYETRGIPLDRTQIATLAGQSYWEQRTFRAFVTTVDARLSSNAEERDAVLAALWATNPPTTVSSTSVQFLPVASRTLPAVTGQPPQTAPQLLYKLTFQRPASRGALPRLEIAFVVSGAAAAAPTLVPAAPAAFQPATPGSTSFSGFAAGSPDPLTAFWTAHPEEHKAVFNFIQATAPANFNQVIEATTSNRQGRVTHRSVFQVQGQHAANTISQLSITLHNQGAYTTQAQQTVPADYRDRDMGDLEIETLQVATSAVNRLGTVRLPANLPADEWLPVKYTIWQYFSAGQARNTEVDAIVPVGSGSRTVLYTFIFGAHNDVTVTRVGEAGTAAGQVDVQRISVTRVNGFPGASASPAALRTWWSTRYPQGGSLTPVPAATGQTQGSTPAAPTAAVLIADMDRLITAGIANRTWFDQNYGIEVLDAAGIASRLQNAHNVPQAMTDDTLDLSTTDLRMLELSLQTLSNDMLPHLRGIKIGRKTSSIKRSGSRYSAGAATQYGLTLMDSSGSTRNITVLYFQSLYANNTSLFRGSSAANALPDVTMGILHELGHAAVENTPAVRTAFQAWIQSHPQTAPTWYAASSQAHELFPEVFALFHTDPHFLCNQAPLLYAWFDVVSSTGTPPAANATLTAPASCP